MQTMKIACHITINGRIAAPCSGTPTVTLHRRAHSCLAIGVKPGTSECFIIVGNNQMKRIPEYKLANLQHVFSKFVDEGKMTLRFSEPPHDMLVTGEAVDLKSFLNTVSMMKRKGNSSNAENGPSTSKMMPSLPTENSVKEILKQKRKLNISDREKYPKDGFPKALEELHINGLKMKMVDKRILNLGRLRKLNLSGNIITEIPNEINRLQSLTELSLKDNKIKSVPVQLFTGCLKKNLILLDLGKNEISHLPKDICKMQNLQVLRLEENRLKSLPPNFGFITSLRSLHVNDNELTHLPLSMIKFKRTLQILSIINNSWENPETMHSTSGDPSNMLLKNIAANAVLKHRLDPTPDDLPKTLLDYLDSGEFCICGRACFESFFLAQISLRIFGIADAVAANAGMYNVPVRGRFCSYFCRERANCLLPVGMG